MAKETAIACVAGYDYALDAATGQLVWFRDLRGGETLNIRSQFGWRDGCQDRYARTVIAQGPADRVWDCPYWYWQFACVEVS